MNARKIIFALMALWLCAGTGEARGANFDPWGMDEMAAGSAVNQCPALPAPAGRVVGVNNTAQLVSAVNNALAGDTIQLAFGIYEFGSGEYLRLDTPGVTLRSASGNRDEVILDGNYQATEIIQVVASNVTIASLTLRQAYNHPIHVMSTESSDTLNTLIYDVHIIDPGEQAIKINPVPADGATHFTDSGTVACSHIELTAAGRSQIRNNCYTGGIDAHQSRGWTIRDNLIEGFWCLSGLSEHAVHLWVSSRDTTVERNLLRNNARGVGFGMATSNSGKRTYADNPCPQASGYVDHYGGTIRNNFIAAHDSQLFASQSGFDCGICLWNACNARILHNTIYTSDPVHTFSSIEWRFANTSAEILNNLANAPLRQRDGASGTQAGNLANAQASWFQDPIWGDLHLRTTVSTVVDQAAPANGVNDDYDGDARPIGVGADIGADEQGVPPPARVSDLRITEASQGGGGVTITLRWTAPPGAGAVFLRYASAPIGESSWGSATVLVDNLSGGVTQHQATIPYSGGTLFFALKGYSSAGGWSAVSNNAFYPDWDVYLPAVMR